LIEKAELEIERIIGQSEVPEDPIHSKNTREWVLRLKPNADTALQIAALGHDIERSIKERKVLRKDFSTFNEFKKAHSINSARILRQILSKHDIGKEVVEKITYLVKHHEFGGDPEADILRNGDSISFFDVNLPFYFRRTSKEDVASRIKWGYARLSGESRDVVKSFKYDNLELDSLFQNVILHERIADLKAR
jgi:hypothetical protein